MAVLNSHDTPIPEQGLISHASPQAAGCGTVGGSADCRVLFPCSSSRLPRRAWTFQFRAVVGEVVEVFKVFSQNRIQQRRFLSRTWTFQFAVEVFKVFPRTLEQIVDILDELQDALRDPGSTASIAVSRDEAFQQFFSHFFPISRKCAVRREVECRSRRGGVLVGGGGGPRPMD